MRISRLTIRGFRGVQSGDLRLGSHTVLVGANNIGKTTVIEALALLFGRDRLVRTLTEHDFFGSAPTEQSRILIIATLTDFAGNEPNQNREWFGAELGVDKWLHPQTGELLPAPDGEGCMLAIQIGFAARFNIDTLEVETLRFFVDDDMDTGDPFDTEETIRTVRGRTLQELGFFLVSATRTWDRWISFSSELFRKVIAATGGLPAAAVRAERDRVREPVEELESAEGLASIVSSINGELANLTSASPKLQLRLTSTDSEGVLQAIVPHFKQDEGPTLPSSRQGSGLASLQSLLLLMQFGAARKAKSQCFVMAVEEPELHVQPSQQKRLVNRLNAVCTQTVVTTHSPVVASMFPPDNVLFLRNDGGTMTGHPLAAANNVAPSNHKQHLFYGWRDRLVAALMHEHVIIPEGQSDVTWLDALQTAIELRQEWTTAGETTRFGTFVGVVPTTDAKISETYEVARAVHSNVLCLVDGDTQGEDYLAQVRALAPPPATVFIWSAGWAMEHVVSWIADADAERSLPALATVLNIPLPDSNALSAHLLNFKSYVPVHSATAEVLAGVPACRARAAELLNDIADVARRAQGERTHLAFWPEESTDHTQVWRLEP